MSSRRSRCAAAKVSSSSRSAPIWRKRTQKEHRKIRKYASKSNLAIYISTRPKTTRWLKDSISSPWISMVIYGHPWSSSMVNCSCSSFWLCCCWRARSTSSTEMRRLGGCGKSDCPEKIKGRKKKAEVHLVIIDGNSGGLPWQQRIRMKQVLHLCTWNLGICFPSNTTPFCSARIEFRRARTSTKEKHGEFCWYSYRILSDLMGA